LRLILVGRTDAEWLPGEIAGQIAGSEMKVRETGKPARIVEIVPMEDGRVTEWLILKFPISTSTGRSLLGGVGIDITKQNRAERALREREAQFRDLFDDAPVAYHELDTEGCLTRVNSTELAMLGYTAQEMVGRPVSDFIEDGVEDCGPEVFLREDFHHGAAQRTFRKKDGTNRAGADAPQADHRQHRASSRNAFDASGYQCFEANGAGSPESRGELPQHFENAIEGIFQSTPDGTFRSVNPAMARLYGYPSPQAWWQSCATSRGRFTLTLRAVSNSWI
jgi:PAS domain S-box-containing protein